MWRCDGCDAQDVEFAMIKVRCKVSTIKATLIKIISFLADDQRGVEGLPYCGLEIGLIF